MCSSVVLGYPEGGGHSCETLGLVDYVTCMKEEDTVVRHSV